MRLQRCIVFTIPIVAWTSAHADAQWVATPYLGMNVLGSVEHGKGGPGGSAGSLGGRVGFELDFMRYQHFFKDAEVAPLDPSAPPNCGPESASAGSPCTDINTDAMGFMGNVLVPIPIPGSNWRPYGTGGLGLIHAWTEEPEGEVERRQNDFALNAGAGVMYSVGRRVDLRADLRYFWALADEGKRDGVYFKDYGFCRVTLGVTFGTHSR